MLSNEDVALVNVNKLKAYQNIVKLIVTIVVIITIKAIIEYLENNLLRNCIEYPIICDVWDNWKISMEVWISIEKIKWHHIIIQKIIILKIMTNYLWWYQKNWWGLIMNKKMTQLFIMTRLQRRSRNIGIIIPMKALWLPSSYLTHLEKKQIKVYTTLPLTIWKVIAKQNGIFEWVEWTCSKSEVGKTSEWLFQISEKARSAITKQFLSSHSKHKEEHECKMWKRAVSVHPLIREALVVFRFRARVRNRGKYT